MRPLKDLLQGEPVALYSFITSIGTVVAYFGFDANGAFMTAFMMVVSSGFGVLRWLVVPVAAAEEQAAVASTAGYDRAVADVHELAATPAPTPVRKPAKKS